MRKLWRWHSRPNGHEALRAQQAAEAKLRAARARAPQVRREVDRFAAEVERAMRGGRA
jgi:hypothetical protein